MRIALNGWFWGQMNTGSGQVLHGLVRWLPRASPDDERWLIVPRQAGHVGDVSGWQVVRVSTPFDRVHENLAKVWFEQIAFPRACQALDVDIAHIPYWGSPWWRPCRIIVTIHDLIPLLLPGYRGGFLQRLYTTLVAHTARRAHLILTDSEASRQDIIKHLGVPSERVRTVYLAADERYGRPIPEEELQRVRERYGLPERFILYLGGFDTRKNVPRLLTAYAHLVQEGRHRGVPLVIAGRLPSQDTPFTPDPRRVARDLGIESWVYFPGWISEEDKPAMYALADMFVFIPTYEGFGLPALEAMMSCSMSERRERS
ncbi:MAG: glycosyltransferase family 4 protein [Anaerolineae bacterium]|nr:glycosyltransferase family 4 protein [Anaerolineae bacterium]